MRSKSVFGRVAMAVVGGLMVAVAPVEGQSVSFSSLNYSGVCVDAEKKIDLWGGSQTVDILNHQGFDFLKFRALDIGHYQSQCWLNQQKNGYANASGNLADVVALGFGSSSVQRVNSDERFTLKSMMMGSGWSDAKVQVSGFQVSDSDVESEMFRAMFTLSPGSLSSLDFSPWSSIGINLFRIDVIDWGTSKYDAHWLKTPTKIEDRTYFVSSMTVGSVPVPEPASIALLAAGLAGLGFAARRRRSVR